ncbi:MAG: hypothetical protein P1P82_16425 [Bacteroidales bacterium]|nr:hypothetical protein [Bacteroidales bacterium]MDT8432960.1 hypothetical protein [Bacteroidales bacterium]
MTKTYINRFKLIYAILDNSGRSLDHKELLSTVDRHQIFKKLEKSNPEMKEFGKFIITEQSLEEENWSLLTEKEKTGILKLYEKIKKSADLADVIVKLLEVKNRYPGVPAIYNYLGIAYERSGKQEQYYDVLIETHERFPDYIFGKISLAEYYLNKNEYKKIPVLFGSRFEITAHFPEGTEIYHISAVRGFYFVTGRYFAKIGKLEMAYRSYFLLSDLDPDHETTEILGKEIFAYELDDFARKL